MTQVGTQAQAPAVAVRRRTAALAGAMVLALAVLMGLRWASGLAPLSANSYATVPIGLKAVRQSDEAATVYRWRRGGTLVLTFAMTNTPRCP